MTKQELKAKIDKLENGIKSKATPSNLIAPLKAQKAKFEKELEDMESAEKKAVKTKKVSKVAEKIKAAKTSVAKKTPAKAPAKEERKKDNIARDGDRKSLPSGKRISKTGKVYYETRANRSDKQTSKKPYLADGGMITLGEHYKTLGKKDDLVGLKVYDKNNDEFVYIKNVDSGIWAGKNKNDESGHSYRMSDLMVEKMEDGGETDGWKKTRTRKLKTREEAEKAIVKFSELMGRAGRNYKVEKMDDGYVISYESNYEPKMADGGEVSKKYVVFFTRLNNGKSVPRIVEMYDNETDAKEYVENQKKLGEKGFKIKQAKDMPIYSMINIVDKSKNKELKDLIHSKDKVDAFFEGKDSFYKKDYGWVKPYGYVWENWKLVSAPTETMAKGGDVYDDMNDEIDFANKKAKKIANSLESLGYKVIKVQEADYDTDAQIDLSEKVNVQVGLEGDLSIVIEKEEGKFTYIDCGKSYATLLQKLPNIDKQYMEKGGKTKRTVKLTLSDKDSYDYTYKQDGATASITFGFGKEPFQYEVKKISKSLEPLQQDILDTFTLQGIKQHDYKGGFSEAIKHLDTSILENMDEFAKGGSTKGNWILRRNIGYGTKYKDLTNGDKIRMNLGNDKYYHGTIKGQEILWEDGIKTNLTTSFGGSNANDKEVLRFAKGGKIKMGDIVKIKNPLPDEDPNQLYFVIQEEIEKFSDDEQIEIRVLNEDKKWAYPPIIRVEKKDLEIVNNKMADGGETDRDIDLQLEKDMNNAIKKRDEYQLELKNLLDAKSQDSSHIEYLKYEIESLTKLSKKLHDVRLKRLRDKALPNGNPFKRKMADGGEIDWGADLGGGFSVGNDVYITDSKSLFQGKTGFVSGSVGRDLLVTLMDNGNERSVVVSKKGVERLDAPEYAKGGELKKAQLLIIDPSNPLSTQLKKLTGDFLNSADFKDIGSGNFNILTHKHSNKIFIVYPKRIYDSLPEQEKQDDISYLKNVEKIKLDTRSMADGGETSGYSYGRLKGFESQDWEKMGREYAGSEWDNLSKNEKDGIISDLQKDWNKNTSFAHGGYVIFEGRDNYNDKPLYKVISKDEDNDYDGEFHDNREDAEKELNELKNKDMNYADGGRLDKYNVSFNYNPSNLSNENAEKIASAYTKNWKHTNDFDEVSFYVMGISKEDADMLVKELKMEDVYNIEVDKSRYASGGYMANGGKTFSENDLKEVLSLAVYHFYKGLNEVEAAMNYLDRTGQGGLKRALSNKLKLEDLKESIEKIDEYTSDEKEKGGYMAKGGKVPAHFGSGKNINVFGYQTENFDICATAVKEFESAIQIMDNGKEVYKESLAKCAKYIDSLFGIEKYVVENEDADDANFYEAISSIMSASIYNYRAEMSINLFSFVPQHLKEIAVRMGKAEKGGFYALGGMTAGRWYKDKSGEEFKFIGKVDSGANKGRFLFSDGQKSVYKDLEDFEGGKPKETKLFGFFEEGGMLIHGFQVGDTILEIYKGYGIVENNNNGVIEVLDPNRGTRFIIDLDESKPTGRKSMVMSKDEQMESAKRYIDYLDRPLPDTLLEKYKSQGLMEKGGYMADGGEVDVKDLTIPKYEVSKPEFQEGQSIGKFKMPSTWEVGGFRFNDEKEANSFYDKLKGIDNMSDYLEIKIKKEQDIFPIKYQPSAYKESKVGSPFHFSSFQKAKKKQHFVFTEMRGGEQYTIDFIFDRLVEDRALGWLKIDGEWEYGNFIFDYEGYASIGSGSSKLTLVKTMEKGGYMAKGGKTEPFSKTGKGEFVSTEDRLNICSQKLYNKNYADCNKEQRDKSFDLFLKKYAISNSSSRTMAKGGELSSIKEEYLKNEDENAHSENVVLLAKHFGTKEDLAKAKEILALHEKEGSLSSENGKKRQELNLKLIGKARAEMSKQGIEFEKGGYMAKGGEVAFDNSNLYLNGFGMDSNGNSVVKVSFPNQRAFSIQTNGVLNETNSLYTKKIGELTEAEIKTIEKEVVDYVKQFGSKEQKQRLKTYSGYMAKGGKVKFADKVKSVQESLLKRKKVAPQVQKDYGKTYDKKEAKESAQRIVGSRMAQLKEKMAKKKK